MRQSSTPTSEELYNFLSGHGLNGGGGFIGGGGISISPTNDKTKEGFGFGFYTPQAGFSYNYTPDFLIFNKH